MTCFLVGSLQVGPENDFNLALQEEEQFVLVGMHFPFVAHTWRVHGENTDVAAIELNGQELNRRLGSNHCSRLWRTH